MSIMCGCGTVRHARMHGKGIDMTYIKEPWDVQPIATQQDSVIVTDSDSVVIAEFPVSATQPRELGFVRAAGVVAMHNAGLSPEGISELVEKVRKVIDELGGLARVHETATANQDIAERLWDALAQVEPGAERTAR